MSEALLSSLGLIIVAVVAVVGQWVNSRNDRALAHQEVDLLKKLDDPKSSAAVDLKEVIEERMRVWKKRARPSYRLLRTGYMTLLVAYVLVAAFQLLGGPQEFPYVTYWALLIAIIVTLLASTYFILSAGTATLRERKQGQNRPR
jgi:cation transport ATPase